MNRWFSKARSKSISLSSAATLLMASAFVGQVLGFFRVKLINANFPVSGPNSTDAYFAAFSIPDFFFYTLAAGALGVAFMPILAEYLHRGDRKGMWEMANSLMNLLAIVMGVVAIVILIFAEPLIHHIVAPNLPPDQLAKAATIMRLLAFNPLLFMISGVLTSSQQSLGRFFFYAMAPLFYNLSIIASAIIFSMANGHSGGPWELGLVGLGVGAAVGAVLQLLVVIFGLYDLRFRWRPKILWHSSDFKTILRNLPPRSLDQGLDQVESIVEINLASRISSGAITNYSNAYVLQTAPILLVGTAISTAAFPRLNNRLAQNRPDLFRKDFLKIFRVILWIVLPVAVVSFFGRGYLAHMIYSQHSKEISDIFGLLVGAVIFRTLYSIISRWFYTQKDTMTPLIVSIFAIGLNVALATKLASPSVYGVLGLALAQSIVAAAEVLVLLGIMVWRDRHLFDQEFWEAVLRILSVTGFTAMTGYIMATAFPLAATDKGLITLGTKLMIITIPTAFVHIAASYLFGLEESKPVIDKIRKFVLRPVPTQVE